MSRHNKTDDVIYEIGYRESSLGEKLEAKCTTAEEEDAVEDFIDRPPHLTNFLMKWQETHWDEGPFQKPYLTEEDPSDLKYQLEFEDDCSIEKKHANELIL